MFCRKPRSNNQADSSSLHQKHNSPPNSRSHSENQRHPASTNTSSSNQSRSTESHRHDSYNRDKHLHRNDRYRDRYSDRNERYSDRNDRYSSDRNKRNTTDTNDRYQDIRSNRHQKSDLYSENKPLDSSTENRLTDSRNKNNCQSSQASSLDSKQIGVDKPAETSKKESINEQVSPKNSSPSLPLPKSNPMFSTKSSTPQIRVPKPPLPAEKVVVRGPSNVFNKRLEVRLNNESKQLHREAVEKYKSSLKAMTEKDSDNEPPSESLQVIKTSPVQATRPNENIKSQVSAKLISGRTSLSNQDVNKPSSKLSPNQNIQTCKTVSPVQLTKPDDRTTPAKPIPHATSHLNSTGNQDSNNTKNNTKSSPIQNINTTKTVSPIQATKPNEMSGIQLSPKSNSTSHMNSNSNQNLNKPSTKTSPNQTNKTVSPDKQKSPSAQFPKNQNETPSSQVKKDVSLTQTSPSKVNKARCSSLIDKIKELEQNVYTNKEPSEAEIKKAPISTNKLNANENPSTKPSPLPLQKKDTLQPVINKECVKAPPKSILLTALEGKAPKRHENNKVSHTFSIFEPEVQLHCESSCESNFGEAPGPNPATSKTNTPTTSKLSQQVLTRYYKSDLKVNPCNTRTKVSRYSQSSLSANKSALSSVDFIPVYNLESVKKNSSLSKLRDEVRTPIANRPCLKLGEVSIKVANSGKNISKPCMSPHSASVTKVSNGKSSPEDTPPKNQNNQNEANCSQRGRNENQTPLFDEDSQDIVVSRRKRKFVIVDSDEEDTPPTNNKPLISEKDIQSAQVLRKNVGQPKENKRRKTESVESINKMHAHMDETIEYVVNNFAIKDDAARNKENKKDNACTSVEINAASTVKVNIALTVGEQGKSYLYDGPNVQNAREVESNVEETSVHNGQSTKDVVHERKLVTPEVIGDLSESGANKTGKSPFKTDLTTKMSVPDKSSLVLVHVDEKATSSLPDQALNLSSASSTQINTSDLNTTAEIPVCSDNNVSRGTKELNITEQNESDANLTQESVKSSPNTSLNSRRENKFSLLSKRRSMRFGKPVIKTIIVTSPEKKEAIVVNTKNIGKEINFLNEKENEELTVNDHGNLIETEPKNCSKECDDLNERGNDIPSNSISENADSVETACHNKNKEDSKAKESKNEMIGTPDSEGLTTPNQSPDQKSISKEIPSNAGSSSTTIETPLNTSCEIENSTLKQTENFTSTTTKSPLNTTSKMGNSTMQAVAASTPSSKTVNETTLLEGEDSTLDANDIVGRVLRDGTKPILNLNISLTSEPDQDGGANSLGSDDKNEASKNPTVLVSSTPDRPTTNERPEESPKPVTPVRVVPTPTAFQAQPSCNFDEMDVVSDSKWKATNAALKNESFNYSGKRPKKRISHFSKPSEDESQSPGNKMSGALKRTPDKLKVFKIKLSPLKKELSQAITTSYKVSSFRDIISTQPVQKTEKINVLTPRKSPKMATPAKPVTVTKPNVVEVNSKTSPTTVISVKKEQTVAKTRETHCSKKQSILQRDINLKLKALNTEAEKKHQQSPLGSISSQLKPSVVTPASTISSNKGRSEVHINLKSCSAPTTHFLIPEALEDNARFVSITTKTSTITATTSTCAMPDQTFTSKSKRVTSFESNSSSSISFHTSVLSDIQHRNEHTNSPFHEAFSLMNQTPFKQLMTGSFSCVSPMPQTPYKADETPRKEMNEETSEVGIDGNIPDLKTPMKPINTSTCSTDVRMQTLQDELALTPDGNSGNSELSEPHCDSNDLKCYVDTIQRDSVRPCSTMHNGILAINSNHSVQSASNNKIDEQQVAAKTNVNQSSRAKMDNTKTQKSDSPKMYNHNKSDNIPSEPTNNDLSTPEENRTSGKRPDNKEQQKINTTSTLESAIQSPTDLSGEKNTHTIVNRTRNDSRGSNGSKSSTRERRLSERQSETQRDCSHTSRVDSQNISSDHPTSSNKSIVEVGAKRLSNKSGNEYRIQDKSRSKSQNESPNESKRDRSRSPRRIRFTSENERYKSKERNSSNDNQRLSCDKQADERLPQNESLGHRERSPYNRKRRRSPSPRYRDHSRHRSDRRDSSLDRKREMRGSPDRKHRERVPHPRDRSRRRYSRSPDRRRDASFERKYPSRNGRNRDNSPRKGRIANTSPRDQYRERRDRDKSRRRGEYSEQTKRYRDLNEERMRTIGNSSERTKYRSPDRSRKYREVSSDHTRYRDSPERNETPMKKVTVKEIIYYSKSSLRSKSSQSDDDRETTKQKREIKENGDRKEAENGNRTREYKESCSKQEATSSRQDSQDSSPGNERQPDSDTNSRIQQVPSTQNLVENTNSRSHSKNERKSRDSKRTIDNEETARTERKKGIDSREDKNSNFNNSNERRGSGKEHWSPFGSSSNCADSSSNLNESSRQDMSELECKRDQIEMSSQHKNKEVVSEIVNSEEEEGLCSSSSNEG